MGDAGPGAGLTLPAGLPHLRSPTWVHEARAVGVRRTDGGMQTPRAACGEAVSRVPWPNVAATGLNSI